MYAHAHEGKEVLWECLPEYSVDFLRARNLNLNLKEGPVRIDASVLKEELAHASLTLIGVQGLKGVSELIGASGFK